MRRGFVMEPDDIERVLAKAKRRRTCRKSTSFRHCHPDKPFSYLPRRRAAVKAALARCRRQAFTPVEIVNFAKMTGKSIREILTLLKEDGLDSLPGVGRRFSRTASARSSARRRRRRRSGSRR